MFEDLFASVFFTIRTYCPIHVTFRLLCFDSEFVKDFSKRPVLSVSDLSYHRFL